MELFPAILIGGPPHSGKSVLTYSLSQALRQRGVQHYVLRAAPDGEGDWANEAAQKLVRTLRVKGAFTPAFVDYVCDTLAARHLPLLVDVGGRPTPAQERIFDFCTHAVLLTPDSAARDTWRDIAMRHILPILAELTSRLQGTDQVETRRPMLRGVITGLKRGATATGPVFEALTERLARALFYKADELYRIHSSLCEAETVVNLYQLARTFDVPHQGECATWAPHHLPRLLDYLPQGTPLGLYGRCPAWIYAAVAFYPKSGEFYQFDARQGWVQPQPLRQAPEALPPLQATVDTDADRCWIDLNLPDAYLDYDPDKAFAIPTPPPGVGVALSGRIPLWLYTGLALAYRDAPWVAIYQPQLHGAVVVHSRDPRHPIGDTIVSPFDV